MQRQATQQPDEQPDTRPDAEGHRPAAPVRRRDGRDRGGSVLGVAHCADGQDIELKQLEHHPDPQPRFDVAE